MEVRVESEEQRDRDPHAGKRRRPDGPTVSSPATVVDQTGREFLAREAEWLACLVHDPASFAAIEREVHEHARRQADLYVAGLLALASEAPETVRHVDQVIVSAEVPLRPVAKKDGP
ncbi:MAG TPA: hypothetical protein VKP69_00360 [Isosphaeraceae bacterium]|nr:hypothetical protein [Isosphaeraceae bacterium]